MKVRTPQQIEYQRRQGITRAYTNVLVRRGKLKRLPCRECGSTEKLEAHHPDYSDPRRVVWLCRPHHKALHRALGPTFVVPRGTRDDRKAAR